MNTIRIHCVTPFIALLAIGCGSDTTRSPDDQTHAVSPGDQPAQQPGNSDSAGIAPCSRIPDTFADCSNGEGNTVCCPLSGDVYLWNTTNECKVETHSHDANGAFECLNSGVPDDPDSIPCVAATSQTCYRRPYDESRIEVIFSNDEKPKKMIETAGWAPCTHEFRSKIEELPNCQ